MALDVTSPLAERIAGPGPEPEVLRSIGASLAWLRQKGLMLETDVEIDPDLELTGVQKHLDGTIPILFHSVKGHPGAEVVTNLFANIEVLDRMFGWETPQQRTVKLAHALTHPMPPEVVVGSDAPCQELVITEDLEVNRYVPAIRHTALESELTVGSGNSVVVGDYFHG